MSSKIPESVLKKQATAERLQKAKAKASELSAKKRRCDACHVQSVLCRGSDARRRRRT